MRGEVHQTAVMAAEAEAPVVDDIWKAAAYGDLEKLREFVEKDPQLVNKPDATGCVVLCNCCSTGPRALFFLLPPHDRKRDRPTRRRGLRVLSCVSPTHLSRPPPSRAGTFRCSGRR